MKHKVTLGGFPSFIATQNTAPNLLRVVDFEFGEGLKCIGADVDRGNLTVELVQRRQAEVRKFDDAEDKLIIQKRVKEKVQMFTLYPDGYATTPGSFRDFAMFSEAMRRVGFPDFEPRVVVVEMLPWVKQIAKMYPTAQLGNLVLDNVFQEPRMIGQYAAKSVDNRLDMAYLQEMAGQIKSVKVGFFHEGVRRSVEAAAKGVLTVTSSDEEDLDHFFAEQYAVLLENATSAE